MPDALQEDTFGRCRKLGEPGIAGLALRSTELHLDEFVVIQGAFRFGDDGGSQAGIADEQHRVQCVPQASKIFTLTF